MFFIIVFSIWLFMHLYIGCTVIPPLGAQRGWRIFLWIALLTLYLLVPLSFLLRLSEPKAWWYVLLFWTAFVTAGFTLTAWPLMLAKDMAFSVYRKLAKGNGGSPVNPGRRLFLANAANLGVLGLSGGMCAAGFVRAVRPPGVVAVDIPIPNLHPGLEGFRIAHITDTHVSVTLGADYMNAVVNTVNGLSPEMISFTGDMVDGLVDEMREGVEPFSGLKSRYGPYFVTGNHEYYWDLHGWLDETRRLGLDTLLNENRIIRHNGATALIAGVTDYHAGRYEPAHETNPVKALNCEIECDIRIMLAHQPKSAPAAAQLGADLQLSGHTHGGQFFPWTIMVPFVHPAGAGLGRINGMWVYVSRGTGYWGPPMRLGSPSEITLVTLRRA